MLTRRERAALTLALECLRCPLGGVTVGGRRLAPMERARDDVRSAKEALWLGTGIAEEIARAIDLAGPMARYSLGGRTDPRVLRVRLALLLRVLLRADASSRCGSAPVADREAEIEARLAAAAEARDVRISVSGWGVEGVTALIQHALDDLRYLLARARGPESSG